MDEVTSSRIQCVARPRCSYGTTPDVDDEKDGPRPAALMAAAVVVAAAAGPETAVWPSGRAETTNEAPSELGSTVRVEARAIADKRAAFSCGVVAAATYRRSECCMLRSS